MRSNNWRKQSEHLQPRTHLRDSMSSHLIWSSSVNVLFYDDRFVHIDRQMSRLSAGGRQVRHTARPEHHSDEGRRQQRQIEQSASRWQLFQVSGRTFWSETTKESRTRIALTCLDYQDKTLLTNSISGPIAFQLKLLKSLGYRCVPVRDRWSFDVTQHFSR